MTYSHLKKAILALMTLLSMLLLLSCSHTSAYINVSDDGDEQLVLAFDDGNLRCFIAVGANDQDMVCQLIGSDATSITSNRKSTSQSKGITINSSGLEALGLSDAELIPIDGQHNFYMLQQSSD